MYITKNTEPHPGILMPMLSHQFAISFDDQMNSTVARQVTKCVFDFVKRRLTVSVEQSLVDRGLLQDIIDVCQHKDAVVSVFHLAGDGEAVCRIDFDQCNAQSHSYVLDYSACDTAVHEITFAFSRVVFVGFDKLHK